MIIHVLETLILEHFQEPYLDAVSPTYGPEAGGTELSFSGGFLLSVEEILIDEMPCRLNPHSRFVLI